MSIITNEHYTHCQWCHYDLWGEEEEREGFHAECKAEMEEWKAEQAFASEDA